MPEYVRVGGLKPLGVSFARSTIHAMVEAGSFPKPVRIGSHRRWVKSEVETWVARNLKAAS
jgi:predicted DNA-binding transcriptional regulator AlpA